jgi:hypothetical protein
MPICDRQPVCAGGEGAAQGSKYPPRLVESHTGADWEAGAGVGTTWALVKQGSLPCSFLWRWESLTSLMRTRGRFPRLHVSGMRVMRPIDVEGTCRDWSPRTPFRANCGILPSVHWPLCAVYEIAVGRKICSGMRYALL